MPETLSYARTDPPNRAALWAFILGVSGLMSTAGAMGGAGDPLLLLGILLGVASMVVGIVAAMRPNGRPIAIAGIVTGALPVALMALLVFTNPLTGRVAAARRAATLRDLAKMKSCLLTFTADNSRFPTTTEGLDALVNCPPALAATWVRQLDEVPLDKWSTAYQYVGPDIAPDGKFHIISAGPDRAFGTSDDLSASQ